MKSNPKKILIICGPTATGKTSLGISLANKLNGEIVSADSRQVYKGMNIATGKDLPAGAVFKRTKLSSGSKHFSLGYYLFGKVPIWMLDIVSPEKKFTAGDYYELGWKVIGDIWERGKLPIVVGGTGFYIKVLTDGIGTMGIAPDWILRSEIEDFEVPKLQKLLTEISPERLNKMNCSDRQNSRRLIRTIEVELHKNRKNYLKESKKRVFNICSICLTAPLKKVYSLINKRIELQAKSGSKKEVEGLIQKGYGWKLPSMTAMGYREWRDYFENRATEREIIKRWCSNEHKYARRQMTWFRKVPEIHWIDITEAGWKETVEKLVKAWYI